MVRSHDHDEKSHLLGGGGGEDNQIRVPYYCYNIIINIDDCIIAGFPCPSTRV